MPPWSHPENHPAILRTNRVLCLAGHHSAMRMRINIRTRLFLFFCCLLFPKLFRNNPPRPIPEYRPGQLFRDFRFGCFLLHRLKFPTSLVLYQTFSVLVLGVIILVGYVDRKSLFCSSRDLLDSFNNPTTFCTISGNNYYTVTKYIATIGQSVNLS